MLIAGRLAIMHRAHHGPEPREPAYLWFGRNARFAGAVNSILVAVLHPRQGERINGSRQ
jgi:hypothetical protein